MYSTFQPSNNKNRMKVIIPTSQNQNLNNNQAQVSSSNEEPSSNISYYPGKIENDTKIKIISRGIGINEKEYDAITTSCIILKNLNTPPPLSYKCIKKIKEQIGGEWMVFVVPETEKNYDFYLSNVIGEKYLTFIYSGDEFHACKIH